MRSYHHAGQKRAKRGQELSYDTRNTSDTQSAYGQKKVTSRGTKYWSSGAIPLIAPEILGSIIADVADLGIVISETGEVLSVLVNPLQDTFKVLERWEGRDIRTALAKESVTKFDHRLSDFLEGREPVRPIELNHSDTVGSWDFPVRYSLHRIGPDGAVLMLGRDLRPVAEMQQQLVKAQVALEQDYEIQRENDTRFRVLMNASTEAMVFVSTKTGQVTEANNAAASLLEQPRDVLVGSRFADAFQSRKAGDILGELTTEAIADVQSPVTAMLTKSHSALSIVPTLFRAAGERTLLCRIVSQATQKEQPSNLAVNLRSLYQSSTDAIVFATDNGDILSANDGFLNLIDTAHDISVRGMNLADYLQRGSVDVKVMIENANRSGRMRMYATRIAGDYGSPRPVEISITRLAADSATIFAFVMRESGSGDATREATATTAEDTMQSVRELVGQATLKDIVAETTNVVEKMCIETAVALTMNNRVAAAEMLGLSRQSLYVKLRKFGLLARDTNTDD